MTISSRIYAPNAVSFLDLGCGEGGSLEFCQHAIGGLGIGVDLNEEKLQRARASGLNVLKGDATQLGMFANAFRYVSMMDFLEHLPDSDTVHWVIARAISLAKDFLWIVGPNFESDQYLAQYGLKFTWSDYREHTTKVTRDMIEEILDLYNVVTVRAFGYLPFTTSDTKWIVPLSTPPDTVEYIPDLHGPKASVTFDRPVFQQIVLMAGLGMDVCELEYIAQRARPGLLPI